jgi:hypothetical protein
VCESFASSWLRFRLREYVRISAGEEDGCEFEDGRQIAASGFLVRDGGIVPETEMDGMRTGMVRGDGVVQINLREA